MKTCMLAFVLSTALFAGPAFADDQAVATTPAKADEAVAGKPAAEERLVCERIRSTGSNKVERVCKTAKQRADERNSEKSQADRDAAERMMRTRTQ